MSNIIAAKYKNDNAKVNSLYSRIHNSILEQKIWEKIIDNDELSEPDILEYYETFKNDYVIEKDLFNIISSIVNFIEGLELQEREGKNA